MARGSAVLRAESGRSSSESESEAAAEEAGAAAAPAAVLAAPGSAAALPRGGQAVAGRTPAGVPEVHVTDALSGPFSGRDRDGQVRKRVSHLPVAVRKREGAARAG